MVIATFVENDYDTQTAKVLIYNSTWFEILMLWLIILFAANIKTYRLTKKEKWPLLVFHLAFIFMFIGGAVTRYVSFEGQMPIKEKQTTNEIISDLTYFKLDISDENKKLRFDKYPYMMSYFNSKETKWPFKRTFKQEYKFDNKNISLKTLDYIPFAKDSVQQSDAGIKLLNIVSIAQGGRLNNYISEGEIKEIDGIIFSFNNPIKGSVQLTQEKNNILISLPIDGQFMSMEGQQVGVLTDSALLNKNSGIIKANELHTLNHSALYSIKNFNFIIPKNVFRGEIIYYFIVYHI